MSDSRLTNAQALAVRALWQTLGENGNLLARSWSKLLIDVEPTELLELAGRLSSKLPKLYTDTIELIRATGAILEAEGDSLIELPYGAGQSKEGPTDILSWEGLDAD